MTKHVHVRIAARARRGWCAAALIAAALAVAMPARPLLAAAITEDNVAEHIAAAKTPADHQALAAYFHAQAKAEGDRVARHEKMLASYKAGGGKPYENMMAHCKDIIAAAKKAQGDYEAMAKEHEQLAK
jgi:hypothetical protein